MRSVKAWVPVISNKMMGSLSKLNWSTWPIRGEYVAELMQVKVGHITCFLHDIGVDRDTKSPHLALGVGPPPGLPVARADHQCTSFEQIPNSTIMPKTALMESLAKTMFVPLVASGHLENVKYMIVGCCIWERRLMVSPSV